MKDDDQIRFDNEASQGIEREPLKYANVFFHLPSTINRLMITYSLSPFKISEHF